MKIDKNKNYYKTLGFGDTDPMGNWKMGVNPTDRDIKVSYRNLSKLHHPDVSKEENAQEIFEKIVEAYKILSGDEKINYDKTSRFGINYDSSLELYDFEFSNESDSISSVKAKADKYDKSNIIDILIELDEFQPVVPVERHVTCSYCDGNGFDVNKDTMECDMCDETGEFGDKPCPMCNGVGKLSFYKCPKCNGDKLTILNQQINVTEEDFDNDDNQFIVKMKGNNDKFQIGKVGNLYIKIK